MKRVCLIMITLISLGFLIISCKKDDEEKEVEKDFFCDIVPDGWQCEFINVESKFLYIPNLTDTPLFIVKYLQPDSSFLHNGKSVHPNLYINIYSIDKKDILEFYIKSQQSSSSCIPIYYGEIKPYYIVTSPCFINNGNFSNDAQKQIMPLHKEFYDKLTKFNSSLYIQNLE